MTARGPSEQRDQGILGDLGNLADGRDASAVELSRRDVPTPQSRSTGSGCRNASSAPGGTTRRPFGLATALATLARNLVRATPTVMGRPTRRSTSLPQAHGHLGRRAGDPLACRARRGTPRRSRVPRRAAWCRRTPRRPPCSPRSRPRSGARRRSPAGTAACLRAAHGGAHAVGLRLVAGREHHPGADDHRTALQPRIVSLLDRGEERVEIGMQDRRGIHCERMFALGTSRGKCCRPAPIPPIVRICARSADTDQTTGRRRGPLCPACVQAAIRECPHWRATCPA